MRNNVGDSEDGKCRGGRREPLGGGEYWIWPEVRVLWAIGIWAGIGETCAWR